MDNRVNELQSPQEQAYHYFQEKISALESEVSRLSPYEYDYRLLRNVVADCLLQGQLIISDLPQTTHLTQDDDLFYTYAWRFTEAKGDSQYGILILKILQSDLNYLNSIGQLSQKQYTKWLENGSAFWNVVEELLKETKPLSAIFRNKKKLIEAYSKITAYDKLNFLTRETIIN